MPRISFSRVGILQARHLDQNTVDALTLDAGLDKPELVDAALNDFDRLIDGLTDALGEGARPRA